MRRATRWAACLAVLGLAAAVSASALAADEAKVSGDLKKMQGTWVGTGTDGQESRWVIDGDSLKAEVGDMNYTCTLTLDPKPTPHTVDIAIKDGPGESAGKTSKGIYKFQGDQLVLCVTRPGVDDRPTDFKAVEDEAYLFELKKEK